MALKGCRSEGRPRLAHRSVKVHGAGLAEHRLQPAAAPELLHRLRNGDGTPAGGPHPVTLLTCNYCYLVPVETVARRSGRLATVLVIAFAGEDLGRSI